MLSVLLLGFFVASVDAGNRRWTWLEGTTWYVPERGLPAVGWSSDTEDATPVVDQTVYTIDHFEDGYFTARTTILLDGSIRQCRWLLGSVTPGGRLLLTFIPVSGDDAEVVQGFGQMRKRGGRWAMVNQMSTSTADMQLVHSANMRRIRPGDRDYAQLPGTSESLPEFMEACWPD
ncbi:MAG: hypothetical protein VCB42_07095 [Myxococcota bacterium]